MVLPRAMVLDLKYCMGILSQFICILKHVHDVPKHIYGHIWNEPGNEGAPKKITVTTWNHGLPVDDHIKKRWYLNEQSGESEKLHTRLCLKNM